MSSVLKFENVSKNYGKKPALNDISFSLENGKIVGLLGPNGSGKTTIIKLINGLLHQNCGKIEIDGNAVGKVSKNLVAYMPDKTYFSDWMNTKQLLTFFSDFFLDFERERAEKMLADLNIDANQKLKTLSKGAKEKVQLVLTMARRAKLYVLDEPIGGVDPAARDYILKTILNNYDANSTIFISTHLIADIEKIFDDVIFLKDGKIILSGSVDDIRSEHNMSIDSLFREVFKC